MPNYREWLRALKAVAVGREQHITVTAAGRVDADEGWLPTEDVDGYRREPQITPVTVAASRAARSFIPFPRMV